MTGEVQINAGEASFIYFDLIGVNSQNPARLQ